MKVGDLVKHYDQLYAGLGLVVGLAKHPGDVVIQVQYNDVIDWINIEDLEIVNASG